MHKNAYTAKTLNGNWCENRFTNEFDNMHNATSNTYLPNPCKLSTQSKSNLYPFRCQPIISICQ